MTEKNDNNDIQGENSAPKRDKMDFIATILNMVHMIFFFYYISLSINSITFTIIETLIFFVLVGGSLLFFILENPYYFYFYIGGYVCSYIISPYIPLVLLILIPEFFMLWIISKGDLVGELSIADGTYLSMGIRMDRTSDKWRASGSNDEKEKEDQNKSFFQKKYKMWILGIFVLICVIVFYVFAFQTFKLNFPLNYNYNP